MIIEGFEKFSHLIHLILTQAADILGHKARLAGYDFPAMVCQPFGNRMDFGRSHSNVPQSIRGDVIILGMSEDSTSLAPASMATSRS